MVRIPMGFPGVSDVFFHLHLGVFSLRKLVTTVQGGDAYSNDGTQSRDTTNPIGLGWLGFGCREGG